MELPVCLLNIYECDEEVYPVLGSFRSPTQKPTLKQRQQTSEMPTVPSE